MKTQAEEMSARYRDDGLCWFDAAGVHLDQALRQACGRGEAEPGRPDSVRYTFSDGSVITLGGDAWDFGFQDCWCWRGAGHRDDCAAEAGE